MIDEKVFEEITKIRKEIHELIKDNRELRELQEEVDRKLSKAGSNQQRRNQVIQEMMLNSWYRVVPVWEKHLKDKL